MRTTFTLDNLIAYHKERTAIDDIFCKENYGVVLLFLSNRSLDYNYSQDVIDYAIKACDDTSDTNLTLRNKLNRILFMQRHYDDIFNAEFIKTCNLTDRRFVTDQILEISRSGFGEKINDETKYFLCNHEIFNTNDAESNHYRD